MNYAKSLAKQLGPNGIRVNAVAPGPIWTPFQVSCGATMEKLEKFGGQTPMGRAGQPAELGSIYVQLAAADSSFATGQVYGSAGVPVNRNGSEFSWFGRFRICLKRLEMRQT
jgi:NAD(P)-dependent dehydrogenase (short-subunit alcohol dehydrogenase family)